MPIISDGGSYATVIGIGRLSEMAMLTLSIFVVATVLTLYSWLAPRFAVTRKASSPMTPIAAVAVDAETIDKLDEIPSDIQNVRGLAVWLRELNTVRVVTLFGKLNRSTSEHLRNALKTEAASDAAKPLVVDLTSVTRMEQPGWAAILWGRDLLANHDRTLRVLMAVGSQPYRSYFRCGVDAALPTMRILNDASPQPGLPISAHAGDRV